MTFNFTLEWDELDEGLKEEKIDGYLAEQYGGDDDYDEEGQDKNQTMGEYQADPKRRAEAERCISAHFPIYF